MKVKIGNKIIDSECEPIMIILSDEDKENIKNMDKDCNKYCCYSDDYTVNEIKLFMEC
jgi:hypothetical protein